MQGRVGSLPVPTVVRNSSTVAFREVAPQKPADDRTAKADDHKSESCHDAACEVGEQEDGDSGIHQNRQHNSKDAFGHFRSSLPHALVS